jgi:hypothetical protein
MLAALVSRGGAMPDQSGRLTPEDHQKIQNWWIGRWKIPVVCPVCKTSEWMVGEYVVTLSRAASDAFVSGTPVYQMIQVGCIFCSHTMLFNAVSMGVMTAYDATRQSAQALTAPKTG